MFLLDTILFAPGKAVLCLFEELAKKAQEEFLDDGAVKQELQDIYGRLEAGTISEQEFEACELRLLQRLEQIARAKFEGSWGTDSMGVERAFLDDSREEENVELPEPIAHAEVLPEVVRAVDPIAPGVNVGSAFAPLLGMLTAAAPSEPQHDEERPAAVPQPEPPRVAAAAAPTLTMADVIQSSLNQLTMLTPAVRSEPQRYEEPPPAVPQPEPPRVAAAAPTLTMADVIQSSLRQLTMLKLKVSALTAVARAESGWRVTAELLERKAVPDTSDLLGVYELHLDDAGNLLRYERTHMRRRCDLGR